MKSCYHRLSIAIFLLLLAPIFPARADRLEKTTAKQTNNNSTCPIPVLSRLTKHTIAQGETIESIAAKYDLIPETLTRLNPVLANGKAPVGKTILVPPFNGIRVQAAAGTTWRDLAKTYNVPADVLFEINGCQQKPAVVFIPSIGWSGRQTQRANAFGGFSGYPLPKIAVTGLGYGWYNTPNSSQKIFHSGIDLVAPLNTNVLAVEAGTVVFAGEQGNYGNLVVINHRDGLQSRYAHLSGIKVTTGGQVKAGDIVGNVGQTGAPDITTPHLHFEVRYKSSSGWVAQDPSLHLTQR
jgi:murein DD-endopeptidase MepM/ murein hydrolase activator NlpD